MDETSTSSESYLNQVAKFGHKEQEQINRETSATMEIPTGDNITTQVLVDFIVDSKNRFRSVFRKEMTVKSMKERLADVLDVNEEGFVLIWRNQVPENSKFLDELVEDPLTPVEIELHFMNSQGTEKFEENIPSMEVITVHPQCGEFKDITVVIEDQTLQKKWLGGYRSKLNGIEYHHATAQTVPRDKNGIVRFHRDTQTAELRSAEVATLVNKATQMERRDLYLASDHDKFVEARSYKRRRETKLYNDAVRVIQRYWRHYCIRKRLYNIFTQVKKQHERKERIMEQVALDHANKERLIIAGAVYPSKRDDFYWFHMSLALWYKRKIGRASSKDQSVMNEFTITTRKALRSYLLIKELNGLNAIEKHKINHKKEALQKEEMRFLEKTGRPKIFKNKSGNLISMDDLDTQRARELKEIYSELVKRGVTVKERLDFLTTFRKMFLVDYAEYEYAGDIVSLVDREITLLTMGMREKELKGVRMRTEQLYMNFIRQKEFNPKAFKYEKPKLPQTIQQEFRCVRCGKLYPASKYPVHLRMRSYTVCTSCDWMYQIGNIHIDLAPYKKLLQQVRQDEMEECTESAVCFLMQPPGMAYLTTTIWHNHSILSHCSDLAALCHVRWLRDQEWSPWNTILLTTAEAQYHRCIPDVYQFYSPSLVRLVYKKHLLARSHFKAAEQVNESLCSSGTWKSPVVADFFYQKYFAEDFVAEDFADML